MKYCDFCGEEKGFLKTYCPGCGIKDHNAYTIKNILVVALFVIPIMVIGALSSNDESENSPKPAKKVESFTHYSKSTATVRGMAGEVHYKNYELSPGDRVVVNDSTDEWYRIKSEVYSNGKRKTGWVKKSALTKYNETDYSNANYSPRSRFTDYTKESSKSSTDKFIDKSTAYYMCEQWVKKRLKSPSTAEFPSASEGKLDSVIPDGDEYQVWSYVDSQNSFGAMIRTGFTCITRKVSEDDWVLVKLEMD